MSKVFRMPDDCAPVEVTLSDDGYVTLSQSLDGGPAEVVVLAPHMLRGLAKSLPKMTEVRALAA